jgi:hypothetical protein
MNKAVGHRSEPYLLSPRAGRTLGKSAFYYHLIFAARRRTYYR